MEGTYRTGHQEHIYIECNAMTAWFEADGTLVVAGSMQCPYYVHKSVVHAFGLPEEKVRIKATAVGGGFGGKEDFPSVIALHAALLARAAGRPVRLAYDRHEDIVGTTKRHPAVVRAVAGVGRDGTFQALDLEVTMDGGAYLTLSPVVLSRALLHAAGPYRWPAVRIRGRVLATHTAPNGAFRGFGAPQTQFALERHVDAIGRAVGLDPYAVREHNVLAPGDRLPTGQILDATTSGRLCLETAEAKTDFRRRWRELEAERAGRPAAATGEPRRGIGLSLYFHGAGFTGQGERKMQSPVTVRLLEDGRIEVLTAMTDMGQGCAAVFPQIAAAAGGLEMSDLVFAPPDTGEVPNSGPTVASRTTMIVGGVIARAVVELRDRVVAWWREGDRRRAGAGRFGVRRRARPPPPSAAPPAATSPRPARWRSPSTISRPPGRSSTRPPTAAPPIRPTPGAATSPRSRSTPTPWRCGRSRSPRCARWAGRSTRGSAPARSRAARCRRWAGRCSKR